MNQRVDDGSFVCSSNLGVGTGCGRFPELRAQVDEREALWEVRPKDDNRGVRHSHVGVYVGEYAGIGTPSYGSGR